MIGKVERPDNNIRYKLVNVKDKYYILDLDRPIWSILFPFFYWFMTHTVYQINQATFEKLKQPDEKKTGIWAMLLPTAVVGPFIGRMLAPIGERFDNLTSPTLTFIILIIFLVIMIIIRIYIHQRCYLKTDKMTGGLDMLPKKQIKIKPAKINIYLLAPFFYFFFLSLFLITASMTIIYNNLTFVFVSSSIGIVFLIANTAFINIGDVKVKYLDDNHNKDKIIT